jgi:hypothetical protein
MRPRLQRSGEIPPDPHQALVQCLDRGHTGCLVAVSGAAERRVYVMLGEILAAHSEGEDARMVVRLRAADRLSDVAYQDLLNRIEAGQPLGEVLFDVVPEEALMGHLFERFRQNLAEFLADGEVVAFQPMDAVFTDNIQVGHDSRALVEELVEENQNTASLREQPSMVLAPGAAPTQTDAEQVVYVRCGERTRVGELLGCSPYEPGRTLALVRTMLEAGMLVGLVSRPRTLPPRDVEPDTTQPAPAAEPRSSGHFAFEMAAQSGPAPDADTSDAPTVDDSFFADEETAEEERQPVSFDPSEGFDDLAAFQDYDTSREGGAFLTDRTLLDRVDLDGSERTDMPASTDTILEMEDAESAGKDVLKSAVSLNFSGPKLAEDEMERKLDVTNDVLEAIAEALDAVDGKRAGQAKMQLLIESASVALAPLFKGVEVAPDGRLPTGVVLKNLRRRPAGEHRRLLNRGLSDLVERALSAADDSLDEEALEAMLEKIAGYQQRFGI